MSRELLLLRVCTLSLIAVGGVMAPEKSNAAGFQGFYFGVQGGYDMANVNYSATDGVDTLSIEGLSASGPEGGGYVGYGWVFDEAYFGFEAQVSYSSAELTLSSNVLPTSTTEAGLIYGGALRAGRIIGGNSLIYGKLAFQSIQVEQTLAGVGSNDESLTGFGGGGGIEVAVTDRASVRLEYQHTWYEDLTFVGGGVTESYETDAGTASVGVVVRF